MKMNANIKSIASEFLKNNRVQAVNPDKMPGWQSMLLVNGYSVSTAGLKKILLPMVAESIGPEPKALKSVIWQILTHVSK